MKQPFPKLTAEEANKYADLVGITALQSTQAQVLFWRDYGPDIESPRTEPAQVTWRKLEGPETIKDPVIYSNGPSLSRGPEDSKYYLSWEDLLSLPFPAEPTPEEQAERDCEVAWKSTPITEEDGPKQIFKAGFMAAKLSAGGKEG